MNNNDLNLEEINLMYKRIENCIYLSGGYKDPFLYACNNFIQNACPDFLPYGGEYHFAKKRGRVSSSLPAIWDNANGLVGSITHKEWYTPDSKCGGYSEINVWGWNPESRKFARVGTSDIAMKDPMSKMPRVGVYDNNRIEVSFFTIDGFLGDFTHFLIENITYDWKATYNQDGELVIKETNASISYNACLAKFEQKLLNSFENENK